MRSKAYPYRQTREFHGEAKPPTPLYRAWRRMKGRCYNPKFDHYSYYGGKGVGVCSDWQKSYLTFKAWALASGYDAGLELDRKDNAKDYSPDNCRWSTRLQQMQNTTRNRFIEAFGEKKILAEWARDSRCAVKQATMRYRLVSGWIPEVAISTPTQPLGVCNA